MTYKTPEEAFKATAKRIGGTFVKSFTYPDGSITARFRMPDGNKTFRPYHAADGNGGGWVDGDPAGLWPLYRGSGLARFPDEAVYLPEGEAKADVLAGVGLLGVASAHGANGAAKTDWTPLAGREVIILPDNDTPGRKFADTVAGIVTALDPPARVRIAVLPGLPPKGDIVDWVGLEGPMADKSPGDIKAAILELGAKAPLWMPADAGKGASQAVLVNMGDVKPERLRWLWPDRIPLGKVTLVFGDPGLGKSFVTLDIAARVSRGMPWPDAGADGAVPGGIILLSAEDDAADTIRPRLDAAGADVQRVMILQGVHRGASMATAYFNLASDLPALEVAVRRTPDARLVIIDPISAYLGGTDSHKNADIRGLMAPLVDLAARHGVAILAVTHMNKGAGGRALYRATGSLAFIAAARAGWLVVADANDPRRRLFLPAKSNLAKEPTGLAYALESVDMPGIGQMGRVAWEPHPVAMTADDALAAAAADPEDRTARESAADWLKDTLASGPMKADDVKAAAKESGLSLRTVRRAQAAAGVKVRRQGFGPGAAWHWFLPSHTLTPAAEGGQISIDGQHTGLDTYDGSGKSEGAE